MPQAQPTFLGIGAHKAGTTWMFEQLSQHPQIWMPPVKEIHFFDRSLDYPSPNNLATASPLDRMLGSHAWERPRTLAGLKTMTKALSKGKLREVLWWNKWLFGHYDDNWYSSLFAPALASQVTGEITPSYSILASADVARMKAVNSNVKILFLIRDPIDRAWSAVRFNANKGYSAIDLASPDQIIAELKQPGMVLRGDYERTLDVYLEHFDSSQILVCFYDAIKTDPIGLMSRITTFLGVSPFEKMAIDSERQVNSSPARAKPQAVEHYLLEAYAPMIHRLATSLGSYATKWDETHNSSGARVPGSSGTRFPAAVHP